MKGWFRPKDDHKHRPLWRDDVNHKEFGSYSYRQLRPGAVGLVLFLLLIAVLLLVKYWPDHKEYLLIPGDDLHGNPKFSGLKQDIVIVENGNPRRLVNQSMFKLIIDSPIALTSADIDGAFSGQGDLYVQSKDPRSENITTQIIYSDLWKNHTPVRYFDDATVYLADDLLAYYHPISNDTNLTSWFATTFTSGTSVFDPMMLLDWNSFIIDQEIPGIASYDGRFRGSHSFLVQATHGITIDLVKADLSSISRDNILLVEVRSLDGALIDQKNISGLASDSSSKNDSLIISFGDLSPGVYVLNFVDLSNSDNVAYSFHVEPQSVMLRNKLFTLDAMTLEVYCLQPSCNLRFTTWHTIGLQNVSVDNVTINAGQVKKDYFFNIGVGAHTVNIPRGDLVVTGFDYAVPNNSYQFTPYRYEPLKNASVLVLPSKFIAYVNNSADNSYEINFFIKGNSPVYVGPMRLLAHE